MYLLLIAFALIVTACGPSASEIRQQQYWSWYQTLTPAQQEREDQRQHERSLAAMQALGSLQVNRPFFSQAPQPNYAPMHSLNEGMIQPRPRTNCMSNVVGNQVYTNCY